MNGRVEIMKQEMQDVLEKNILRFWLDKMVDRVVRRIEFVRQVHIAELQDFPRRRVDRPVRVQFDECLRVRFIFALARRKILDVRVDLFDFIPVDFHRDGSERDQAERDKRDDENDRNDNNDLRFHSHCNFTHKTLLP